VAIEDDVFLGPSCVLTNVSNPRTEIRRRGAFAATRIRRGATVGANATVVCGITVGRHAFIPAGAVVTHEGPDYALVGRGPPRPAAWMGRHGEKLVKGPRGGETDWICPASGMRYREEGGVLRCLELDEEAPLAAGQGLGVWDAVVADADRSRGFLG